MHSRKIHRARIAPYIPGKCKLWEHDPIIAFSRFFVKGKWWGLAFIFATGQMPHSRYHNASKVS
jgi:hypothetical protein